MQHAPEDPPHRNQLLLAADYVFGLGLAPLAVTLTNPSEWGRMKSRSLMSSGALLGNMNSGYTSRQSHVAHQE